MAQSAYEYPDITPSEIPMWMTVYREMNINRVARGEQRVNVHFHGAPGCGKTVAVTETAKAWAEAEGLAFHDADNGQLEGDWETTFGFVNFRAALMDSSDVKGYGYLDEISGKTVFFPPELLPTHATHGRYGVLFIDDIADGQGLTVRALNSLIEGGRVGNYVLPDGWIIVAASNQREWSTGAGKLGSHTNGRFGHFNVVPSAIDTANWLVKAGYDVRLANFLRKRPELIFVFAKVGKDFPTAYPSARSWTAAGEMMAVVDDPDILEKGVASFVGEGPATEFAGYLRMHAAGLEIPSWVAIQSDPHGAPIPMDDGGQRVALHYVVIGIIANNMATADELANVVTYTDRLDKDFQVTLMHDLHDRNSEWFDCPAGTKWKADNQNVILGQSRPELAAA